jgi:hypothetical protein
MSCTIHQDGKRQIISHEDTEGMSIIIAEMIKRLETAGAGVADMRKNLVVAMTNVAELPNGF